MSGDHPFGDSATAPDFRAVAERLAKALTSARDYIVDYQDGTHDGIWPDHTRIPIEYCDECEEDREQIAFLNAALQDFERAKGGK